MRARPASIAATAALSLVVASALPAHAAPPNDSLSAAQQVIAPSRTHGASLGATIEEREPLDCGHPYGVSIFGTVWYRLSVEHTVQLLVHARTRDKTLPVAVAVGGPAMDDLAIIECGYQWPASFMAQPGTTYLIQVGASSTSIEPFALSIAIGVRPTAPFVAAYAGSDGTGATVGAFGCAHPGDIPLQETG